MAPLTPLVRPKEYFETRESAVAMGFLVFILHVLSTGTMAYLLLKPVMNQIPEAPPMSEMAPYINPLIFDMIAMMVVGFLIVSAIMHGFVSREPAANGSFTDAMGVAGWAYAPNILYSGINNLYIYQKISTLDLEGASAIETQRQLQELLTPDPIQLLFFIAITIWSVHILSEGVAGTHEVDVDHALVPAIIVGIGAIALSLFSMV